jgi:hypothetical protein
VTPARRDPSVLDPMAWLWWPVVMAGWSLAAVVMGAEMAMASAPRKTAKVDRR